MGKRPKGEKSGGEKTKRGKDLAPLIRFNVEITSILLKVYHLNEALEIP